MLFLVSGNLYFNGNQAEECRRRVVKYHETVAEICMLNPIVDGIVNKIDALK